MSDHQIGAELWTKTSAESDEYVIVEDDDAVLVNAQAVREYAEYRSPSSGRLSQDEALLSQGSSWIRDELNCLPWRNHSTMKCGTFPVREVCVEVPDCSPAFSVHNVDFSKLVRMHWEQVFRICLRITRNEHDAEDAAQDCFLCAFAHLHQFQGKAQISTWLHSIARNCSLMFLRKRGVRREVSLENPPASSGDMLPIEPAHSSPDQLSRVLSAESHGRVLRSIAALPPTLRSAADLIILNELTLQEAGQILEISNANLKSRIFRARRRLSRSYGRGSK
jgi:RNA polymerase sigma-70 factor, ECF subfamily